MAVNVPKKPRRPMRAGFAAVLETEELKAPPAPAVLARSEERYSDLNFKLDPDTKRRFKIAAAKRNMKMVDLFRVMFDHYEQSFPIK